MGESIVNGHINGPTNPMVTPILTDLYQFTMAYAYWKASKHNERAVFDLYFRRNPFGGEYTIFAGLEECIKFIANFKFTEDEIAFIRSSLPQSCEDGFFEYLRGIDCSDIEIYAISEGSVVFPKVPLMRIEGAIAVVQLLETPFVNLINFASLVTTNAARHRFVAGKSKILLEFGLRRAQGGMEDFAVEASGQQPPSSRNSSKRSRAAEVHNLSEKRRRSRINEKMKALQNLIPNSNKTDKASMLDEAIEYLKQLQLQVQMLTMKNGLFPLGLPRVLQQNQLSQQRMGACEGDGFMKTKVAEALHVDQDTSLKAIFSPSNNCTETKPTPVATMSNVNLGNAFESESSINTHLDPFQLFRSAKGIWREDWLPLHEMNERPSKTISTGANVPSLVPFDTDASNMKNNTLEACLHRYQLGALNETNMDCDQLLTQHLYSHVGRSTSVDIIKNECSNF